MPLLPASAKRHGVFCSLGWWIQKQQEAPLLHLIITDAWLAKSRAIHLTGAKLTVAGLSLSLILMVIAAGLYHWVFLKGAREGWPLVGVLVKLFTKDEADQQSRFLRESIDVMARKVGEVQARLMPLEALGERVFGPAGANPQGLKVPPRLGGALVSGPSLTSEELWFVLSGMDKLGTQHADFLTVLESRLFDQKIRKSMLPTRLPVFGGGVGAVFGWCINSFTGRSALHTGLDFSVDSGIANFVCGGARKNFMWLTGTWLRLIMGINWRVAMPTRRGCLAKKGVW